MPTAALTPDLLITSYQGSRITFMLVPTSGGDPISDLASYSQISFSVWSGTPDAPGAVVLPLYYTGADPLYITVVDWVDSSVDPAATYKAIQIDVPASVSKNFLAGQYFAELWVTPAGGDPLFTGYAIWNHAPTTMAP